MVKGGQAAPNVTDSEIFDRLTDFIEQQFVLYRNWTRFHGASKGQWALEDFKRAKEQLATMHEQLQKERQRTEKEKQKPEKLEAEDGELKKQLQGKTPMYSTHPPNALTVVTWNYTTNRFYNPSPIIIRVWNVRVLIVAL